MCRKAVENAIKYIETNIRRNKFADGRKMTFEYNDLVYSTDGYQILRTLEDFEIPEASDKVSDTNMKLCENYFEDERYFAGCSSFNLPGIDKLESEIKNLKSGCKSKSRPLWKVRLGYALTDDYVVDAEYLLNAIKATGCSSGYAKNGAHPLLMFGEDTQYILFPVIKTKNFKAGEVRILH